MEAKKTKRRSGGAVSLPEEIIVFEVLARLPVKQLCRLRCVSKRWRALISDPAFAAARKSLAAPLLVGVFAAPRELDDGHYWNLELRVVDSADGAVLRVVNGVKSPILVPTCLGLVCVDGQERHGAMVIDPATGRVTTVGGAAKDGVFCRYSFGRAPSGAYKVVRRSDKLTGRTGRSRIWEIATLGADGAAEPTRWRQMPAPPVIPCRRSGCPPAAVNGVLYFMARNVLFAPRGTSSIVSLDLEIEQWKTTIKGPVIQCSEKGERWEIALCELNGALSLVETVHSPLDGSYANIWLLVDSDKSIWVKEYTIQMPKTVFLVRALDVLIDGRVLLFSAFGIGEEQYRFPESSYIMQLYDPNTRVCTDLMEMTEEFRGTTMALYTGDILSCWTIMGNPSQNSQSLGTIV
ncbi:hypothetical protein ACP70R_044076 [Stipagrostis hirtigluma subsp. patula]